MMEKIPFAFIFDDGVVCCPSDNGCEDDTLVDKWSVGVVSDGIAEQVAVACGI